MELKKLFNLNVPINANVGEMLLRVRLIHHRHFAGNYHQAINVRISHKFQGFIRQGFQSWAIYQNLHLSAYFLACVRNVNVDVGRSDLGQGVLRQINGVHNNIFGGRIFGSAIITRITTTFVRHLAIQQGKQDCVGVKCSFHYSAARLMFVISFSNIRGNSRSARCSALDNTFLPLAST